MRRFLKAFISIFLVSAILFSFASCGSPVEEQEIEVFTTDEATYKESLTPVGNTSEEVLKYFNRIVNKVKNDRPSIAYTFEKSVPDSSLKITKKGAEDEETFDESLKGLNAAAEGIKNIILEDIKKESGNVPMGDDNTDILYKKGEMWTSALQISDISYAVIKEVGDKYYINIVFDDVTLNGDASSLVKAFDLRDKDEILASEEINKISAYLEFNDYDVAYSSCTINAVVNRFTDLVESINYYRASEVTSHMTGAGDYADLGEISVIFTLEDKSDYTISYLDERPTSPLEASAEA